jgi:hypothetical protein
MTSIEGPSFYLLVISLLGALGGAVLLALPFWMLRQQRFLHELLLTVRDLEERSREAQRDLFLILWSHLDLRDMPHNGQQAGSKTPSIRRPQGPETKQGASGLTVDEVRLLVALSKVGDSELASIADILKSLKGLGNLEAKLRSLRNKEFIFYSDLSDTVVILPKGRQYLGLLRS